ncbi:MAG: phosphate propanoyltransferase [Phycisphaerales bacterium]|nr:MAG: phosphate propanoyltransferase [Phycisphaerales bacterium]
MTTIESSAGIDRDRIERIVSEVVGERFAPRPERASAPLVVNISARHVHITQEHLEQLFGAGAELTPMRWLYQQGDFASEQTVHLIGPRRRMLQSVRILGPVRDNTQIELALSDAIALGIDVPVRMSGNHEGTPGCLVLGPKGHLYLERGVIRAQRHVHMNPAHAERYGVGAGDSMNLVIEHRTCPVVLGGVKVRPHPRFKLEVHIDTDEGNACDLRNAMAVRLEKPAAASGRRPGGSKSNWK